MDTKEEALKLHKKLKGKLSIKSKQKIKNKRDLSLLYTPGVAEACQQIYKDEESIYDYTIKNNSVAIVSDGSAVLGLGDIGPKAALPVMEGKAVLFKEFADVDAYPLCITRRNVDEFVQNIVNLSHSFGGINLEDIKAPYCFEIEEKLKAKTDIPIFHDDQHGTAIVVLAGLFNALKLADKKIEEIKIIITGAGAAGFAVTKLLKTAGAKNIKVLDSKGVVYKGRKSNNEYNEKLAEMTESKKEGRLEEAIKGSDVFIGVSTAGILKSYMVKTMNEKPIIFALANPEPEINPKEAYQAGAFIVATGRSDYPNQINNVLAFPGVFRGVLDARASEINEKMKLKAAEKIAEIVKDNLNKENIIPEVFNKEVAYVTALAVAEEAVKTGVAHQDLTLEIITEKVKNNLSKK
ncbi:MAG TPA: NADP-dependent malic enzyme [Halanaerobiales bacterium]|nr:NADP-dependent malic enzyme [Halanaerobiales bacterium]